MNPFVGLAGRLLATFIISPPVSFGALIVTLGFHAVPTRPQSDASFEDVRRSMSARHRGVNRHWRDEIGGA